MESIILFLFAVAIIGACYKVLVPIAALFLGIIFDNVLFGLVGMVLTWILLMLLPKQVE